MIKYNDRITIDPWPFKMYLDGKPIDSSLVHSLGEAYHLMEITEYILNNYDYGDEDAWNIAVATSYRMEKYNISELDALNETIEKFEKGECI